MIKIFIFILFSLIIQGCSSNFKKIEEHKNTDIPVAIKDIKKACKELSDEFLECFKSNVQKIE